MQATIGACKLELVTGDITRQATDAIVNAANSRLAGGGGVDGAIHRGGGPGIMEETQRRYPQGCPTGDAVVTEAGNLPARYVIHAVGPIWKGGHNQEEALLAGAYRRSLEVAGARQCASVAFPSLSTGAYAYPLQQAFWKGGHNQEEALLAGAYRRSLEVAGARQCANRRLCLPVAASRSRCAAHGGRLSAPARPAGTGPVRPFR